MESGTHVPHYYQSSNETGHDQDYNTSGAYASQTLPQGSRTLPRSGSFGQQNTSNDSQEYHDEYFASFPTKRRASAASTMSSPAMMNGYNSMDRRFSHNHSDSQFLRRISSWSASGGYEQADNNANVYSHQQYNQNR